MRLERLGLKKCEAPIFYTCPVGIRFEIGVSSPDAGNKVFSQRYIKAALKRAYAIYQNAPGSFDTLLWVIYPNGNTSEDKVLDRFINITDLPLPQERYAELLPQDAKLKMTLKSSP